MEAPAAKAMTLDEIQIATDYGSWWWFIFITVVFSGLWYLLNNTINIAEISANWPKYRCSPSVMPFASVYGYDTAENFQYCMKQIFQGQVGGVTGPFATILTTMTSSLMEILNNLNSLRVMIATLVGSIGKMMQEFVDRFKLAMSQIKLSGLKIQTLMRRLFGTFYAVIYMGLSAVMVGQNFSETVIFKFLDTFCFAPETLIEIQNKGTVEIQDVKLGDRCSNGARVISTYRFMADGQPMVWFGNIEVSSNHLVWNGEKWIESEEHENAWPGRPWRGGSERPLICLDTETHQIPIDKYIFSDWDETHESDEATMKLAEERVNGRVLKTLPRPWKYQPAFHESTEVVLLSGETKQISEIALGDELKTGKVVGLGKRLVKEITTTASGTCVTPSTLVWNEYEWIRAGHQASETVALETEQVFYTLVVLGTATVEVSTGEVFRDMLEVHSPDMENLTFQKMGV